MVEDENQPQDSHESPPDEPLMTQWRVIRALAGLELLLGP